MSNIYKGTLGLVGNTPLVEVTNIEKELGLNATVLVKLEYFNPAGSVKDRIAKAMIEAAEEKGLLKDGSVIIEPTSGNTGITNGPQMCFRLYDSNDVAINPTEYFKELPKPTTPPDQELVNSSFQEEEYTPELTFIEK